MRISVGIVLIVAVFLLNPAFCIVTHAQGTGSGDSLNAILQVVKSVLQNQGLGNGGTSSGGVGSPDAGQGTGSGNTSGEMKRPALADMCLTGTITKVEKQNEAGNTATNYFLTDNGGNKIMLPSGGKHKQDGSVWNRQANNQGNGSWSGQGGGGRGGHSRRGSGNGNSASDNQGGRRGGETASPSVNLEKYVDKEVTITGRGFQTEKDGQKTTRLVSISKVETVSAASADE